MRPSSLEWGSDVRIWRKEKGVRALDGNELGLFKGEKKRPMCLVKVCVLRGTSK